MRHYIVATAGHVDHGKSSLVKALTGTDPDRLPEEKARQITIDLGFAELNLVGPDDDRIHAGIVDVPGHEDFIRNMIAGVGSIDLALFVVAADDGWMQQSEEHLQILSYLGVRRAVVALTKCDLGGMEAVVAQIREKLRETPFADAPIVPTSIRTGAGIAELKEALAAELGPVELRRDLGKPRLFIDRVFTLHGIGTVVTGTLSGGKLRTGQNVVIQPKGLEARIRSLQSHGVEHEFVSPGMRVAVNLPDIAVEEVKRGEVITLSELGPPSGQLVVRLTRSNRAGSVGPIKNGSSVYFHHGTTRLAGRIGFLGSERIGRVSLSSPIFAFAGDRFVIRDGSEQHTIGGGVVLDPDGRKFRTEFDPDDVESCLRAELRQTGFVRQNQVLLKSRFAEAEIADGLERMAQQNEVVIRDEIAVGFKAWQDIRRETIALIDDAHSRNPDRVGLDLSELRTKLGKHPDEKLFNALISDLCVADFSRVGSAVARTIHTPTLPVGLQSAAARIRTALSQQPFDPPARKEIETDSQARQVVRFMIEAGEVIELGPSLVLLRESFERMKETVIAFISRNGPATVSDLRQELESSRRIMIPFLERLDGEGVTRRIGDTRCLR